jgi:predicted NAD-dependent protein-ADP-ribosyltransferase YbiA (DUF1768 family)
MRVHLKNGLIVLAADDDAERAQIADMAQRAAGHVFALESKGEKGCSLHDLGPREAACREPINISYDGTDEQWRPISNLAETPFHLDGQFYASIEGFWQGLKYQDLAERKRIAQLHGTTAKRAGSGMPESATVVYQGNTVAVGRPEHWALMRRACDAKFTQNKVAKAALLATGERPLMHRMRRDSRTIPGAIMAEIWMRIRRRMREGVEDD